VSDVTTSTVELVEVTVGDAELEAIGPLTARDVLIVRGIGHFDVESREAFGRFFIDRYGMDCPLIVLAADGFTIEALDEEAMNAAGWFRKPADTP
jgi:hypothetical protein